MTTTEYIRALEKEIKRLDDLVKFYESIILSNDELREKLKESKKYYGSNNRRNRR